MFGWLTGWMEQGGMSYLEINTFNPATRPLSPSLSISLTFSLSLSHFLYLFYIFSISFKFSLSLSHFLYLFHICSVSFTFSLSLSHFMSLFILFPSFHFLSLFSFLFHVCRSSSHFYLLSFFSSWVSLPLSVCLFLFAFSPFLISVYLPVSLSLHIIIYIYHKHTICPALTMTGLWSLEKNTLASKYFWLSTLVWHKRILFWNFG